MARPAEKTKLMRGNDSFDVVCTIGSVRLTDDGPLSPYAAAMLLIAEHDAPGEFRFPHPTGGETLVTVEYPPNQEV